VAEKPAGQEQAPLTGLATRHRFVLMGLQGTSSSWKKPPKLSELETVGRHTQMLEPTLPVAARWTRTGSGVTTVPGGQSQALPANGLPAAQEPSSSFWNMPAYSPLPREGASQRTMSAF